MCHTQTFHFLEEHLAIDLPVRVVEDVLKDGPLGLSDGEHDALTRDAITQHKHDHDGDVLHQLVQLKHKYQGSVMRP